MCQLKYFEKIALRVPDRARQDAPDSFVGSLVAAMTGRVSPATSHAADGQAA